MKLSLETPAVAPSYDNSVVERALRKFLTQRLRLSVLYTGGDRQTVKFTGLLDAEARTLVDIGLATITAAHPAHRFRVQLTAEGNRRRDALAPRGAR